ncbi:MAG TPA: class I lanthipeptide [Chitinophaga sp.]|uniref:class I lanthipeptide n=1 Tax=Chitinophaga sp. TaxID=1869181 RepID=UPI002C179BE8|nr:class I lanthipeptide [Chitinophaga sp.]HVI43534.1 class I lanthipeptide [Chitinophaga sp.]
MKRRISLPKKLFLQKATIAELNSREQSRIAGGAATQFCPTRFDTCETYVGPTQCVKCPD